MMHGTMSLKETIPYRPSVLGNTIIDTMVT